MNTNYYFFLDENLTINAGLKPKDGLRLIGQFVVEDTSELLKLIELLQEAVDMTLLGRSDPIPQDN